MKHAKTTFSILLMTCLSYFMKAGEPGISIVPFQLIGNSIFVKGSVNGTKGNFLLDTGSPNLLLNNKYFQGIHLPTASLSIMDIHGQSQNAEHFVVTELSISNCPLKEEHALVVDLQQLELTKGISIAGIIGYSSLRNLEIVFDFDNWVVWLLPLDRKGNPFATIESFKMVDSFKLRMSGHISYITANFNGKKLRLGIDSGSEVNMINRNIIKRNRSDFEVTGHLIVRGLANEYLPCGTGTMENIQFQPGHTASLDVALADMYYLNNCLNVNLHGLLGAPFLMQGKVAINFRKRRLYLGQTLEEGFARLSTRTTEKNLVSADK